MVEITILELNLNAEDLIANAPFSSGGKGNGDDEDEVDDPAGLLPAFGDDDDEGDLAAADDGRNLKPVAVGAVLLVLVLAVVAGRRLLGGEPEPLP
jgi:hypothetical protein